VAQAVGRFFGGVKARAVAPSKGASAVGLQADDLAAHGGVDAAAPHATEI
jgi:hypothetical protein